MLAKLLQFLRKGKEEGAENVWIIARSPRDGKKHTFRYEGQMTGFGRDEGHLWTDENGYTFSTDAIVEANEGEKDE